MQRVENGRDNSRDETNAASPRRKNTWQNGMPDEQLAPAFATIVPRRMQVRSIEKQG